MKRRIRPGVLLKVKNFGDKSNIHLFNDDSSVGGRDNLDAPRIEVAADEVLIAVSSPVNPRGRTFHIKVLTTGGQTGWANLEWIEFA